MPRVAKIARNAFAGIGLADVAPAAVLFVAGQIEVQVAGAEAYRGSAPLAVSGAAAALTALPLLWRRRAPLAALVAVIVAIALPRFAFDTTVLLYGGLFPVLLALYSASCYAPRPHDRTALVAVAALVGLLSLEIPDFRTAGQYAFMAAAVAAAWLLGQGARRWRANNEQLRAALAELALVEDARREGAIARERARIARELHDVIAHGLNVMVIQAGSARLELLPEQEQARDALLAVERAGREAMVELRHAVGVLRPDDDEAALAAQPSLDRLDALVTEMNAAGLVTTLQVSGVARPLSAGLELSAYRIAQEAMTNALKHAGTVPVEVSVRYGPAELVVEVRNDAPSREAPRRERGGHGLIGMHERASLFGGSLEAGPLPAGGYRVVARLPLPDGDPAPQALAPADAKP